MQLVNVPVSGPFRNRLCTVYQNFVDLLYRNRSICPTSKRRLSVVIDESRHFLSALEQLESLFRIISDAQRVTFGLYSLTSLGYTSPRNVGLYIYIHIYVYKDQNLQLPRKQRRVRGYSVINTKQLMLKQTVWINELNCSINNPHIPYGCPLRRIFCIKYL